MVKNSLNSQYSWDVFIEFADFAGLLKLLGEAIYKIYPVFVQRYLFS